MLWLETGRQAGAARARKGQSQPQRSILYKTASRLPFAYQGVLGFWVVDILREGRSQRSAPQKRHKAYLRRAHLLPLRKPSGWDGGGDKMHHTWG